jgi:hypothetical protein
MSRAGLDPMDRRKQASIKGIVQPPLGQGRRCHAPASAEIAL